MSSPKNQKKTASRLFQKPKSQGQTNVQQKVLQRKVFTKSTRSPPPPFDNQYKVVNVSCKISSANNVPKKVSCKISSANNLPKKVSCKILSAKNKLKKVSGKISSANNVLKKEARKMSSANNVLKKEARKMSSANNKPKKMSKITSATNVRKKVKKVEQIEVPSVNTLPKKVVKNIEQIKTQPTNFVAKNVVKSPEEIKLQRFREKQQQIRERYSPKKMREIYVNPNKHKLYNDMESIKNFQAARMENFHTSEIPEIIANETVVVVNPKIKIEPFQFQEGKSFQQEPIRIQDTLKNELESFQRQYDNNLELASESIQFQEKMSIKQEAVQIQENLKTLITQVKYENEGPKSLAEIKEKANQLITEAHRMIWYWLFHGLFPSPSIKSGHKIRNN